MTSWLRPAGSLAATGEPVRLAPQDAGWERAGLRVLSLAPGETRVLQLGPDEAAVVPLAARDVTVDVDGRPFVLTGRDGVFAGVTDCAYATVGATVSVSAPRGGEVAVATARAQVRHPPAHRRSGDVAVEIRGAGPATRQVNELLPPTTFAGADRLVVVEVLTPGGNWSSWPPHRHDGVGDCPVANEEIYYFRIGRDGEPHGVPGGWGFHRTYTAAEDPGAPHDESVPVGDGDVFLIPRGYHGPCVAAPGYPMYYLNVLAGPGERSLGFCDDPEHTWARETWSRLAPDPRVPFPAGRPVAEGSG